MEYETPREERMAAENFRKQLTYKPKPVSAVSDRQKEKAAETGRCDLVRWTSDIDQFIFIKRNRIIDEHYVEVLKKSMQENGVYLIPALVNEKMEVMEGQHRLAAAKALGIAFPYIVQPGLTADDIPKINKGRKNWKLQTYIDTFARDGNENYVWLKSMQKKYKLPDSVTFSICKKAYMLMSHGHKTVGQLKDEIEDGDFVNKNENAEKELALLGEFVKYLPRKKGSVSDFLQIVTFAILYDERITSEKLLRKFEECKNIPECEIESIGSDMYAAKMIDKIYNYNRRGNTQKIAIKAAYEMYRVDPKKITLVRDFLV